MRLNAVRPAVPARCSRGDLAGRLEPPNPAYSAGDADPKTLGRRIARHAPFYYSAHNTFAKIVRKRHHPPPPSRGEHQESQTDMIRESPRFSSMDHRSNTVAMAIPLYLNIKTRTPTCFAPRIPVHAEKPRVVGDSSARQRAMRSGHTTQF